MDLNHQPRAYEYLLMAVEVPLALLTNGDGMASGLCPIQLSSCGRSECHETKGGNGITEVARLG